MLEKETAGERRSWRKDKRETKRCAGRWRRPVREDDDDGEMPRIKAGARGRNKFRRKEMRTMKYTDAECVNHGTIMPDVNPARVRLRAVHLSGATSHKTWPHGWQGVDARAAQMRGEGQRSGERAKISPRLVTFGSIRRGSTEKRPLILTCETP